MSRKIEFDDRMDFRICGKQKSEFKRECKKKLVSDPDILRAFISAFIDGRITVNDILKGEKV